jgi:hypothetical protein
MVDCASTNCGVGLERRPGPERLFAQGLMAEDWSVMRSHKGQQKRLFEHALLCAPPLFPPLRAGAHPSLLRLFGSGRIAGGLETRIQRSPLGGSPAWCSACKVPPTLFDLSTRVIKSPARRHSLTFSTLYRASDSRLRRRSSSFLAF